MYVRTEVVPSVYRPVVGKRVSVFVCDQCGIEYKRKYSKCHVGVQISFCSKQCKYDATKRGGIIYPHHLFTPETREKAEQTYIERYGVPFGKLATLDDIKQKIVVTTLKNYGVSNVLKLQSTIEAHRTVCRENGNEINQKRVNTCLEKYGVPVAMQAEEVKSKIDYHEIAQKSHDTMKRNGTFKKSGPENKLYELLCEKFGNDNVERQTKVNGWAIDFYIKTIDLYIQLDGVYWHGLDRPIEDIKKFEHKRDSVIYTTYMRDIEQVMWFKENNKRLVRGNSVEEIFIKLS